MVLTKAYITRLTDFSKLTNKELIQRFNSDVGHSGWGYARMLFVGAMHEEFIKRKFDYSLIGNEKQMSWKRKIKITRNNKIIFEESNIKVKIDLEGLLENKKLRLVDIEGKTNLSYQQLLNIKKGRTTKISFDTIGRLLNAFKCKPNDLFKVIK